MTLNGVTTTSERYVCGNWTSCFKSNILYLSHKWNDYCVCALYSDVVRLAEASILSRWRRGAGYSYPCNRKKAQLSCIVGCYGCAATYGRYVYDMGACCRQCQLTQAEIIDVGPEQCSAEFITAPGERKLRGRRNYWREWRLPLYMSSTFHLPTDVMTRSCWNPLSVVACLFSITVLSDHSIFRKCFF